MSRRLALVSALGLAFSAFAVAFAPTVVAGDPCYHGYTIPPATSAATASVSLEPCAFAPTLTRVAPGTTVTFANKSDFTHLITGAGAAWGDRDRELAPGAVLNVTFDQPGIYPYSCALHRGMSGAIVVGSSTDVGTATVPADDPADDTTAAAAAGGGGLQAGPTIALSAAGGLGVGLLLAGLVRRSRRSSGVS